MKNKNINNVLLISEEHILVKNYLKHITSCKNKNEQHYLTFCEIVQYPYKLLLLSYINYV